MALSSMDGSSTSISIYQFGVVYTGTAKVRNWHIPAGFRPANLRLLSGGYCCSHILVSVFDSGSADVYDRGAVVSLPRPMRPEPYRNLNAEDRHIRTPESFSLAWPSRNRRAALFF